MAALPVEDALAHRALESLVRAETAVRRRLAGELAHEGVSPSGFAVLVVLQTAGGELPLRVLRRRLQTSKANATEVVSTLAARGFVRRSHPPLDRRAVTIELAPAGRAVVERLFPQHSERVRAAFAVLDEDEKRSLAAICRKLAA